VVDRGHKDRKRMRRVAGGWVCQVCGLRFVTDQPAYAVVIENRLDLLEGVEMGKPLPVGVGVHAMDHGLLHQRCLRLALAHCPELRRRREAGELYICRVPPGSVEAFGPDVVVETQ
jgi:hypothetical protein